MPSTAEIPALVEATRHFVRTKITPHVRDWESQDKGVPAELLDEIGKLGYYGLLVPEAFGGSDLDMATYARVIEELAAGDCGLCNLIAVNNSPVAAAIRDHGSPEQKQQYLAGLAAGTLRSCFMLTEAEAGSDAATLKTRATRDGEHYVLSGSKRFVTAGNSASFAMLVAVTDPEQGKNGMSCFLVPRDSYQVARLEDKLGHRNCDTAEVVFDDVRIDASCRLGVEGDGYRIALAYLNNGRIGVAAQAVGVARAALEAAVQYAGERKTFGDAIINHQAIAFRLADMATRVTAARQLTIHAADRADDGKDAIAAASMAKIFASEAAEAVTSAALQIHGGYGYLKDFPVEKYARDARVLSIYEGTNDIQRMVIARQLVQGWRPEA
ncbi:MAG: acyl-CoA dehydrogenase family protein [Gammaproteobacteria bacterium]